MITILNNCLRLVELGSELENLFGKSSLPHVLAENFKRLKHTYIVSIIQGLGKISERSMVYFDFLD